MTDTSSDAAPGKASVLTRLLRPFTAAVATVQALRPRRPERRGDRMMEIDA